MIIRNAVLNDMEDIKVLYDELNRSSVELLPGFFKIAHITDEQVEELLNSEKSQLIVVEEDGKVIGLAEIHLNESKDLPILVKKKYIYIQNFIVHQDFRRRGIGRALIEGVKKWGTERGIKSFRLSVIPGNSSAIEFYKNIGFGPVMYSMEVEV